MPLFYICIERKDKKMNTYPKLQEPFAFWLVQQFLPAAKDLEEDVQPINNREFYSIMSMIVVVIVVLDIIFHGLPL
jgi:hypothetical protein